MVDSTAALFRQRGLSALIGEAKPKEIGDAFWNMLAHGVLVHPDVPS